MPDESKPSRKFGLFLCPLHPFPGTVCAPVIDDYHSHLRCGIVAVEHGPDYGLDYPLLVFRGNDHGDLGSEPGISLRLVARGGYVHENEESGH